jgi:hypothetical protein
MSKLQRAPVVSLCPTQLTVGILEVEAKKRKLQALSSKDQAAFLAAHPMPVVLGPAQRMYITDHHHLARAAYDLKIPQACFEIEGDFSTLAQDIFWIHMEKESWVHPLDHNGVRHRYESIPRTLDKLVDDVYRSVAGFVRDAGGYDKTQTAFAEFIWADYFRRNIAIEDVLENFANAVKQGMALAHDPMAKRIPGYKG